ncbi:extradiol ring-cleavage dioxygenase [Alicyclobacillus sp. TC]|uniref:Aromatic ring-opening dioxygenase LigB subunit n=2 Tax=Alicyclobacillus tolerans TaxID=90970 RepID=A0ABT9LTP2_9BACL|nr:MULTISPECIES: hypothetical protein [Alicyclobacillus]MDP9727634.1 aromatic ring-opening dioxygenase LigB subunit [Alicyclobacillus tengchongensis]QRF24061.1 extradiol ring-cleavage dioxygenase [Alicyclobacillus sp. TC]SHJ63589.1 Aromatic ring-opening dioxygenase, LigB subunit [Alicyclobacillus montanus]
MNPFVHTLISPHGFELIPSLDTAKRPGIQRLRSALEKQGKRMTAAKPDLLVVLTPHGLRTTRYTTVTTSTWVRGLAEYDGEEASMECPVAQSFAVGYVEAAEAAGLPLLGVQFATAAGPLSVLPLDWGSMVPLWFMPDVPVVIITPARNLDKASYIRCGELLAEWTVRQKKRVGLIASCDWAHTHHEGGPYGFAKEAVELDQKVRDVLMRGEWEEMADWDSSFVEAAKPDGIPQILMLAGAVSKADRKITECEYECPTYFGMLVAGLA